jgi:hypothetical protein
VGFCGIFEHFSGFEFFLLPSIVHARPHAGNANRWAVVRKNSKQGDNNMLNDMLSIKNLFSKMSAAEQGKKEIEVELLKIREQTLVFDNAIYYIPNIAKIEIVDLSTTKPVPSLFWILLAVSAIIFIFTEYVFWGVVSLVSAGAVFFFYWQSKSDNRYGIEISLNSNSSTILISTDLEFLKKIMLVLYNIMNGKESKPVTFNFKTIEIKGGVKGSTIISGDVDGNIVNNI